MNAELNSLESRPQRSMFATLGLMIKGHIPINAPFGQSKSAIINPRLEELERKISRNFFEAAEALRTIREEKLYLTYAETFKEYCEKRLNRSIQAVYLQLKALEISQELAPRELGEPKQTSKKLDKLALSERHLRKMAQNASSVPKVKKLLRDKPSASSREIEAVIMNETVQSPESDDRLLEEIIARIRRARRNRGFLEALKEWLDQSEI